MHSQLNPLADNGSKPSWLAVEVQSIDFAMGSLCCHVQADKLVCLLSRLLDVVVHAKSAIARR